MKNGPWHPTKQNVHRVCTNCNTGNNIETENLRRWSLNAKRHPPC